MRWVVLMLVVGMFAGCIGTEVNPDAQTDSAEENKIPDNDTAAPEPLPNENITKPTKSATPVVPSRVVGATFDTGTNPFHPCFRLEEGEANAWQTIPEIAGIAKPLRLTFEDDYDASREASEEAIQAIEDHQLYVVEGTRLLFYGATDAYLELVDGDARSGSHGAQASSQIVCKDFGMGHMGFLLIANWYDTRADARALLEWVGDQTWIDVVHLNIQEIYPYPIETTDKGLIQEMADAGQYVVLAAGNGYGNGGGHIPMETIHYNTVDGTWIAGANDGTDYTSFSNLNPHGVMDGCGTEAADAFSYGTDSFGGTSSASPRTTGYAMNLLQSVRDHFDVQGGTSNANLVELPASKHPATGPLADGALDIFEMHEVMRKTADPSLPASLWDGASGPLDCTYWLPQTPATEDNDYHRIGYGKLTNDTLAQSLKVLVGDAPMPERPYADAEFERSQQLRQLCCL